MSRLRLLFLVLLGLFLASLLGSSCAPFLCQNDDDCKRSAPEKPHCQLAKCKECLEDSHCKEAQVCIKEACSSNFAKDGHACDPLAQSAPKECTEGATCETFPLLPGAGTYCIRACNIANEKDCPQPQEACVRTSAEAETGHCMRINCNNSGDCAEYPGFQCTIRTDKRGKVCTPPTKEAGSLAFGMTCTLAKNECTEGFFCIKMGDNAPGKGICTKSCIDENGCQERFMDRTGRCLVVHGELKFCAFRCFGTGSEVCPKPLQCIDKVLFCQP